MADETNDKSAEEAAQPETETPVEPEADHHLKAEVRGAVAKVVGLAVEAGSMLSGYSGAGVSAESQVAEADTEDFLDRIDGEG